MTLLLDTHAVLWFWWADPQLSTTATTVICDPANRKLVSTATAWEVAIKVGTTCDDQPFETGLNLAPKVVCRLAELDKLAKRIP